MSLTTEYTEAQNPATQARVQMAMLSAAQNIASADPSEPNHNNRVQLASQVSRAPQMYTVPFTSLVCAQGITDASTDAEIETMVSAVWNTMAGQPLV